MLHGRAFWLAVAPLEVVGVVSLLLSISLGGSLLIPSCAPMLVALTQ